MLAFPVPTADVTAEIERAISRTKSPISLQPQPPEDRFFSISRFRGPPLVSSTYVVNKTLAKVSSIDQSRIAHKAFPASLSHLSQACSQEASANWAATELAGPS